MAEISRIFEALFEVIEILLGALVFLLILPFAMLYQYAYLKWRREVKLDE